MLGDGTVQQKGKLDLRVRIRDNVILMSHKVKCVADACLPQLNGKCSYTRKICKTAALTIP